MAKLHQMGITKKVYRFRCFAYSVDHPYWGDKGNKGDFIVECIDLNLMVRGCSINDAYEAMQDVLSGYLETVMEGPDIDKLLYRPSPLSHRLHYHWNKLRSRIRWAFYGDPFWDRE